LLLASELQRLRPHAAKIWSLRLSGTEFSDETLSQLPSLPRMEILELTGPIRGGGLRALAAHRKLRVLRIELPVDSDFEVPLPWRCQQSSISG